MRKDKSSTLRWQIENTCILVDPSHIHVKYAKENNESKNT